MEILSFFTGLVPFFEPNKLFLDIGKCSQYNINILTEKDTVMLQSLQEMFVSSYAPKWKDSIVIHHKLPGQAVPPSLSSSRYLIGRMMSESTILTRTEVYQTQIFDEIWVPTVFHQTVFESHGIPSSKIQVIPEAVDVQFYSDDTVDVVKLHVHVSPTLYMYPPSGVFRFLSIFKYEKRKGADVLLSAYWGTFKKEDNVELVIRSYKPSWEPGSSDLYKVFNNIATKEFGRPMSELASVVWIKRDLPKSELHVLYQSADVFVLPTRGEGWCLPCAESLAAGTPVIVTNFSGPAAYMSDEHSYPLGHAVQLNSDGTAEPNKTRLGELMHHVVAHPAEVKAKSDNAKSFAAKFFEPTVVALKVIKRLNAIDKVFTDSEATYDHPEL
jgi:glycosyltransferase involved in cell wall biosynthesis